MWPFRRRAEAPLPVVRADWRMLPPLQRIIQPHPLINPVSGFSSQLASWQNPSFLAPLAHAVGPAEPAGSIADVASPVEFGPPLAGSRAVPDVSGRASSGGPVVSRMVKPAATPAARGSAPGSGAAEVTVSRSVSLEPEPGPVAGVVESKSAAEGPVVEAASSDPAAEEMAVTEEDAPTLASQPLPVVGSTDAPETSSSTDAPPTSPLTGGPATSSASTEGGVVQRSALPDLPLPVPTSRPRRLGLGEPISSVVQRSAEPARPKPAEPSATTPLSGVSPAVQRVVDSGDSAMAPLTGSGPPIVQRAAAFDAPADTSASDTARPVEADLPVAQRTSGSGEPEAPVAKTGTSPVQRLAEDGGPPSPRLGMPVVRQAAEPAPVPPTSSTDSVEPAPTSAGAADESAPTVGLAEPVPVLGLGDPDEPAGVVQRAVDVSGEPGLPVVRGPGVPDRTTVQRTAESSSASVDHAVVARQGNAETGASSAGGPSGGSWAERGAGEPVAQRLVGAVPDLPIVARPEAGAVPDAAAATVTSGPTRADHAEPVAQRLVDAAPVLPVAARPAVGPAPDATAAVGTSGLTGADLGEPVAQRLVGAVPDLPIVAQPKARAVPDVTAAIRTSGPAGTDPGEPVTQRLTDAAPSLPVAQHLTNAASGLPVVQRLASAAPGLPVVQRLASAAPGLPVAAGTSPMREASTLGSGPPLVQRIPELGSAQRVPESGSPQPAFAATPAERPALVVLARPAEPRPAPVIARAVETQAPPMPVVARVAEPTPDPAVTAAPPAPVVQRVEAPQPEAAQASQPETPQAPQAQGQNADELLRKLYDPLLRRLKADLWLDRERRGALTDL